MTKVLIMAWFGGALGWVYAQLRDGDRVDLHSQRGKIFWVLMAPLWPVLILAGVVGVVVLWCSRRLRRYRGRS